MLLLAGGLLGCADLPSATQPVGPGPAPSAALPPENPNQVGFTIAAVLRFVMLEGTVAPRSGSATDAEITATFRVENRGTRPVVLAAREVRFLSNSDFPVQSVTGLQRCQDLVNCRGAQATVFPPGTAITVRLVAPVTLRGRDDPRLNDLRAMEYINLSIQLVRFREPGDPDYEPPNPRFPRPPGVEDTFVHSISFSNNRGRMANAFTARP